MNKWHIKNFNGAVTLFQVNTLPARLVPEEETQEVDLSGWLDPAEVSGNTVLAFAAEGKAPKASVIIIARVLD